MVNKILQDVRTSVDCVSAYIASSLQREKLVDILLIVFLISLLFDFSGKFVFLSLLVIILFAYIKLNMSVHVENYKPVLRQQQQSHSRNNTIIPRNLYNQQHETVTVPQYARASNLGSDGIIQDVVRTPFAYDAVTVYPNDVEYKSINNALVGTANPKTFIAPVIVPPIADLDYWKANNTTKHSQINSGTHLDVYQSGYVVSNPYGTKKCDPDMRSNDFMKLTSRYKTLDMPSTETNFNHNQKYHQKYSSHQLLTNRQVREDYVQPSSTTPIENIGLVNRSCGYNPDQFKDGGLPVNLILGDCEDDPAMAQYNRNLFTQTIQPGVYTTNQVNEPINSNIGISYNQQFEPETFSSSETGGATFEAHNPLTMSFDSSGNILNNNRQDITEDLNITPSNVYDPRFSGYGTSYRAYTDPTVGQTRFFYDDVDSVRMPNYVVRSKIDFAPFADTYGAMNSSKSIANNSNIRGMANQQFLDDSLLFRTGMQERLMRKTNADAWQQRMKPIHKHSQRMMGAL